MTIEEINKKLIVELEEEIEGAEKYHAMAVAAREHDREDMCMYLFAMAKDEMTHAKAIHDFLEESSVTIPTELDEVYKRFESAHKF